jgi:hypothetical protein
MNKRIAVEQITEADLLAVMPFSDKWFDVKQKSLWFYKKKRQLAQATWLHRSNYQIGKTRYTFVCIAIFSYQSLF